MAITAIVSRIVRTVTLRGSVRPFARVGKKRRYFEGGILMGGITNDIGRVEKVDASRVRIGSV